MPSSQLLEEALTRSVIGGFFEVYNTLGFGFVEHVCASALAHELRLRGHSVLRERGVDILYKGERVATQRLDMIVDGKLVVETKATRRLEPGACRQLYNYLRATNLEVGLLLHFGAEACFYRVICSNGNKKNT